MLSPRSSASATSSLLQLYEPSARFGRAEGATLAWPADSADNDSIAG